MTDSIIYAADDSIRKKKHFQNSVPIGTKFLIIKEKKLIDFEDYIRKLTKTPLETMIFLLDSLIPDDNKENKTAL